MIDKKTMLERFISYVKINSRSDEASQTVPTTQGQIEMIQVVEKDLIAMGLQNIFYNENNGFLTALLPKNIRGEVPAIGLIAHVDTADFPAENIQPKITENYNGQDVLLNVEKNLVLSVEEFPNLKDYIGETLITTDGTTLLGADDKAGIVEILAAVEYFLENPDIAHGDILLAFGPDEEIGRGADLFDAANFPANFAYTIDSGRVGCFEYETFNAAQAIVEFDGTSVHPGTAFGTMINAIKLSQKFDTLLPQNQVPEKTRDYEGFYLLTKVDGTINHAKATYIIRDHDRSNFEERKAYMTQQVEKMNKALDKERVRIRISDQYYNMKEIIEKDSTCVDLAVQAMRNLGIKPQITPFRGGTDGSKISFMGIPTPNIFTGGENFHGQYEFITLEAMEKAAQTIAEIIKENVKR